MFSKPPIERGLFFSAPGRALPEGAKTLRPRQGDGWTSALLLIQVYFLIGIVDIDPLLIALDAQALDFPVFDID